MSRPSHNDYQGNIVFAAPKALRKLASNPGWIDQDALTIRRMNRAEAGSAEIANALGWSILKLRRRLKEDGIVLRNKLGGSAGKERAASAHQDHLSHGRGVWHDRARELRISGLKYKQIAAILGFSYKKVAHFFSMERARRFGSK